MFICVMSCNSCKLSPFVFFHSVSCEQNDFQMICLQIFVEFFPHAWLSSVQSLSHVWLFVTPWTVHQASLSITNSQTLWGSAQTHVHWVGDAIQLSHPLSSPSPPALSLSQHQGLFKWVTLRIRWPKYWGFSFNISASNEQPGPISFRMDWLDLLAVQGTLSRVFSNTTVQNNSLALSFLHSPTLTSIHDHWKNHSFDYMDLCWQSNVSAF